MLALLIVAVGVLLPVALWVIWRAYREEAEDRRRVSELLRGCHGAWPVDGLAERMKAEIEAARTLSDEGV